MFGTFPDSFSTLSGRSTWSNPCSYSAFQTITTRSPPSIASTNLLLSTSLYQLFSFNLVEMSSTRKHLRSNDDAEPECGSVRPSKKRILACQSPDSLASSKTLVSDNVGQETAIHVDLCPQPGLKIEIIHRWDRITLETSLLDYSSDNPSHVDVVGSVHQRDRAHALRPSVVEQTFDRQIPSSNIFNDRRSSESDNEDFDKDTDNYTHGSTEVGNDGDIDERDSEDAEFNKFLSGFYSETTENPHEEPTGPFEGAPELSGIFQTSCRHTLIPFRPRLYA